MSDRFFPAVLCRRGACCVSSARAGMVCVLLALAPSALAKDTSPLALTFGLGAQYDSNVIIDDADFNRRNGDGALLTSGTLSFAPLQTRKSSLRFAYTFDGVTNFKLPEVNLAIHGGSASASRRFGKVTLGLDYQFNHIVLGPRPYLDTHLVSPSLSILVTPRLLVRGAFFYQRKNFTSANRLDAHTKLIALDAYRFFSKRKGYIALGLRGDDESTTGAEFSYRAIQGSARVQVPLKVLGIDARIRASYAYSERSYRNETPSIAERRFEKRSTLTAGVDLPLGHGVTLKPQYRYVDRRSNVPAFNYRAHLASTMVTLKF